MYSWVRVAWECVVRLFSRNHTGPPQNVSSMPTLCEDLNGSTRNASAEAEIPCANTRSLQRLRNTQSEEINGGPPPNNPHINPDDLCHHLGWPTRQTATDQPQSVQVDQLDYFDDVD